MAKLKYRVRVLLGDQELVLLVPAAPETTVGELQADILARARFRRGAAGQGLVEAAPRLRGDGTERAADEIRAARRRGPTAHARAGR